MTTVYVVCARGFEGEFESVAAFSSYELARKYINDQGYSSWSLDSHTVDNPED
jgi:hypothetical protein